MKKSKKEEIQIEWLDGEFYLESKDVDFRIESNSNLNILCLPNEINTWNRTAQYNLAKLLFRR